MENVQTVPGLVFQHADPVEYILLSSCCIHADCSVIMTSAVNLFIRYNLINLHPTMKIGTYWLLEEKQGQSSIKRHVP